MRHIEKKKFQINVFEPNEMYILHYVLNFNQFTFYMKLCKAKMKTRPITYPENVDCLPET
jgi:hypothetical protein